MQKKIKIFHFVHDSHIVQEKVRILLFTLVKTSDSPETSIGNWMSGIREISTFTISPQLM